MTSDVAQLARDITPNEVASFHEHGWAKLENFISADLAARLLVRAVELMGETGDARPPRPGIDTDFMVWTDYSGVGREGIEPFAALSHSPAMGRAAHQLSGRDIGYRLFTDLLTCRQPADQTERNKPTPPHQDYPSHSFDRIGYVNFWIALSEIPPERGSLRFYSGSHREGSLGWDKRSERNHNREEPWDVFETYPELVEKYPISPPLHLGPGDATCHNMYVLHSAPVNETNEPRWAYITSYIPCDALYVGSLPKPAPSLVVGEPFDDPKFPVVWTPETR
jgi:hypothetical protein